MGILSNRVQCPFAEPVPQARVASSPVRVAGSAVNEGSLCELGLLLLCLSYSQLLRPPDHALGALCAHLLSTRKIPTGNGKAGVRFDPPVRQ